MIDDREDFWAERNECGPTTAWEPRPAHTMTDLMRIYRARQPATVCHLSTCWCGHFKPDWLELCFTCDPTSRHRWVKEASNG